MRRAARWLRTAWHREVAAAEAGRCDGCAIGCTRCHPEPPPELAPLHHTPPPPVPTTCCPGHHGPCWLAHMPHHVVDDVFGEITAQLNDPKENT